MRGACVHVVILGTLFFAARAQADGPCVIHVDDVAAPRAWRSAVDAAARVLGSADTGDCADILVTPEARGAMVTFTTRDGRIAQRHIDRPTELQPLVDALTVVVMPALPEPPSRPEGAIGPEPAPVLTLTESTPDATVPVEEPTAQDLLTTSSDRATRGPAGHTQLLLFAGGGARMDARSDLAAQGQIGVGVAPGEWELDLVGRLEAEHDIASLSRQHAEASSMGVTARAARRENVGPLILVAGVSASTQYASVEAHPSRGQHDEVDFLEPRAGAFVGVVGPRIGRFRLRGELVGEMALSPRAGTAELPATSGWGLGCMFGLETSFLP